MTPVEERYGALAAYTLTHGDPAFIHQHVVDAFTAQTAGPSIKPIAITFALAGLYLHVEHGFTGREVQKAHMRMAREKHRWPPFDLPEDRGAVTADDVLRADEGEARDAAIHAWCASVWGAFSGSRETVRQLLIAHGVL